MLRAMTGGGGGAMDMAGVDDAPAVALEYDAEHAAMLERLDGLLTVVAPGLERGAVAEEGAEGQLRRARTTTARRSGAERRQRPRAARGHAPPPPPCDAAEQQSPRPRRARIEGPNRTRHPRRRHAASRVS